MIAIVIAGLMAVASIWNGILRDSVIHAVDLLSSAAPENVVAVIPWQTCVMYWALFLAALVVAVYLAFIDIRYIRLQYALEKQQLLRQSLGDDLSSKVIEKQRNQ